MGYEDVIREAARVLWNCEFHPGDVASGEAERRIADWPDSYARIERKARAAAPILMEYGARLMLEKSDKHLASRYGLRPLSRDLDPATIVREAVK